MTVPTVAPMRSRVPRAIALAVTAASLAACGSSGAKASTTTPATKASSVATSGTGKPASAGDKSSYPDLCKVLTKADIAAAFKATAGEPQPGSDNDKSCSFTYSDAGGSSQVFVTYNGDWVDSTGMAKAGFDIVPVDGVGTDAWYGVGQFHMRWGTEDVVILAGGIVGNPDAKPGAVALGTILLGRLPKA
jgi:hypothetical protein